ncbi:MAG: hypothetical protein JW910_10805 [Anaerolineae bacterium]|nr:hypothetical protein [Anaerolineae bacterium]
MHILVLHLHAPDLAAQHEFYAGPLGLPVTRDDVALNIQVGATRLVFEQAAAGTAPRYHFAFNIPENQFAAAKAWVSARMPLLTDPEGADEFTFEPWNAHAFYFADAAGNILECIARHDLPNASTRPFTADSLLNVCEIGLPGQTVAAVADPLQDTFGVPQYSGDRETFAALGDPNGLFILVPNGHGWLPGKRVCAASYPVAAWIAGLGEASLRIAGLPYQIQAVRVD